MNCRVIVAATCFAMSMLLIQRPIAGVTAANPPLRAWLYTSTVYVAAAPASEVSVLVKDTRGAKAQGDALADNTGRAIVRLADVGLPGGRFLRPDDTLVVSVNGAQRISTTVPTLLVDTDRKNDRIDGRAEPGATVHVEMYDGVVGDFAADARGLFSIDLSGQRDLISGDYGQARYMSPDGFEYWARFSVFDVDITTNSRLLSAHLAPGSMLHVTITTPSAEVVRRDVLNSPVFMSSENIATNVADIPFLAAGSRIVMQRESVLPGVTEELDVTVPEFDITLDQNAHLVAGTAPAGTKLTLEVGDGMASSGFRAAESSSFSVDANSSFVYSVSATIPLGPGWRVIAYYHAADRVMIRTGATLPVIEIPLHGTELRGLVRSGVMVTLTLSTASNVTKSSVSAVSQSSGKVLLSFHALSGAPAEVVVQPGDTITIDQERIGDPRVIRVPMLNVQTDVQSGVISGSAPAGTRIAIETHDKQYTTVITDVAGKYYAQLPQEFVVPGAGGEVILESEPGVRFHTAWIALKARIEFGNKNVGPQQYAPMSAVYGNGIRGRTVEVALRSADGKLVSAWGTKVSSNWVDLDSVGVPDDWSMTLAGMDGQPLVARPGDVIEIRAGDDRLDLRVPKLEAAASIEADTVSGASEPGIGVQCVVARDDVGERSSTVSVIADVRGVFACDFANVFNIRHGDDVFVTLQVDAATSVVMRIRAHVLIVDLSRSTIDGTVEPNTRVSVDVTRGGHTLHEARVVSAANGNFRVDVGQGARGHEMLRAGDEILVLGTDSAKPLIALVIPDVSIDYDRKGQRVFGNAPPDSTAWVIARGVFDGGGAGSMGSIKDIIDQTGRYEFPASTFSPSIDLRYGTRLNLISRVTTGHKILREIVIPVANVQYGAGVVCGFGPIRDQVILRARDASGRELGDVRTATDIDGRFEAILTRSERRDLHLGPGDTVTVQAGREQFDVRLEPLSVLVNWDTTASGLGQPVSRIEGSGPHLRKYLVAVAAGSCFRSADGVDGGYSGITDGDGMFSLYIDRPGRGKGVQVAFYTKDWQRYFRQAYRGIVQVFVHQNRIRGIMGEDAQVQVLARDKAGNVKAEGATRTDAMGRFQLDLSRNDGSSAVLVPGDRVILTTQNGITKIPVEELAFDFSARSGVMGITEPSREVGLLLQLADGRQVSMKEASDERGRFSFSAGDIWSRENWTMGDVRFIRATLATVEGHEMVQEVDLRGEQQGGGDKVYLPWVGRTKQTTRTGRHAPAEPCLQPRCGKVIINADAPDPRRDTAQEARGGGTGQRRSRHLPGPHGGAAREPAPAPPAGAGGLPRAPGAAGNGRVRPVPGDW